MFFSLKLGNGCGWLLKATKETNSWMEQFAAIMQLKRCSQNEIRSWPQISFENPPTAIMLHQRGWKKRDLQYLHIWSHPSTSDVICEIGNEGNHTMDAIRMSASLYLIYSKVVDLGGLPLHAALIERDKKGILLAAPGNTGKTTCCLRLPPGWHALCDDESLIVRNLRKSYSAHPFPTWSDLIMQRQERTWNVQKHVALTAIFFLKQAEVDKALPLKKGESAARLIQSAIHVDQRFGHSQDSEEIRLWRNKLFENVCDLAQAVPAFKLQVSASGRFWEEIERVLQGKK